MSKKAPRFDHNNFGTFRELIRLRMLDGVNSPGHAIKLILGKELSQRGFGKAGDKQPKSWHAFFSHLKENFYPELDEKLVDIEEIDKEGDIDNAINRYWTNANNRTRLLEAFVIYFWLHQNKDFENITETVDKAVIGGAFADVFGEPFPNDREALKALNAKVSLKKSRAKPEPQSLQVKIQPELQYENQPETLGDLNWKLSVTESEYVNERCYNFSLDDKRRRPNQGEQLVVFSDVTIRPQYIEQGLGFSFNSVELHIPHDTKGTCDWKYELAYQDNTQVGKNGTARHWGGPTSGHLVISSTSDTALNDNYCLYELPYFTLSPISSNFHFDAELRAYLYDVTLVAPDGRELEDKNKSAIITALLTETMIDHDPKDGKYVLSKHRFTVSSEELGIG